MQRFPTYGYRRLAIVLGENKKPIQRILQIKGWQVRKRSQGFRPRAKALPSVTHRPDERWATDICHIWCGRERRGALAAVIDCCTREILGWRLSSSGATATAEAALEEALISRLGHLQRIERPLVLRSDNGLVFFLETLQQHGQSVWTDPRVHHVLHAGAEWADGAVLPILKGGIHLAAPGSNRSRMHAMWSGNGSGLTITNGRVSH